MIAAIVLAAGESRRMGALKQLLPFGGTTVVERAIDALLASQADEIIVVLGYEAERVRGQIGGRPVRAVVNERYGEGMLTSVQRGVTEVPEGAEAFIVALGDQPLIEAWTVDRVIAAYRKGNRGIVIPTYRGRRGHPILIARKYRDAVLSLSGDVGLREVIRANADDVLTVEMETDHILKDMDYPEEYREALREMEEGR